MNALDQALQDETFDKLKHLFSERALTGDTMVLNMGPHHPSTHGVLRLILELDGEIIVNAIPDIGFLHTGVEKNMESKTYLKALVMTDRLDYLNTIGNNFTYCLAIEKLVGVAVPERAQVIRVILAELQRLASHLVWLGTFTTDVAAQSILFYAVKDRNDILALFEMMSGQRMMTSFIRPGGLWRDLPEGFLAGVQAILPNIEKHLKDWEAILGNPIWKDRTQGIGVIDAEAAQAVGVTGPSLRAAGVNFDLRKAAPYSGYEQYDFNVPLGATGDIYDRYAVRMAEFRESIRIIRQAIARLPNGPVITSDRKVAPPPRSEIGVSMESLIHHFKLWTEGFSAPAGDVYVSTESPRGELGVYLVGNGGPKPHRVYWRTPSFYNLQALALACRGAFIADVAAIIPSLDPVMGDVDR